MASMQESKIPSISPKTLNARVVSRAIHKNITPKP